MNREALLEVMNNEFEEETELVERFNLAYGYPMADILKPQLKMRTADYEEIPIVSRLRFKRATSYIFVMIICIAMAVFFGAVAKQPIAVIFLLFCMALVLYATVKLLKSDLNVVRATVITKRIVRRIETRRNGDLHRNVRNIYTVSAAVHENKVIARKIECSERDYKKLCEGDDILIVDLYNGFLYAVPMN